MKISILNRFLKPASQQAGWFAVSITNKGVYFVHVQHASGKPKVLHCSFHSSPNVTTEFLEKLRKEEHIGNFQFTTLLGLGEYQIILVDSPNVPESELKSAVRWSIKDALSYPVDTATVDVLPIPPQNLGSERPKSLYVIAAQNVVVLKCISMFERANMNLKVIDIPETAQRNVAILFEKEGRGLALLAFNDLGGMLTFTFNGELILARRIEITLGQLEDADERQREQFLDRFELELQRSMDYFGRQFHYISLNRLLVSSPEYLGLIQRLSSSVDLPVQQLNLSEVLDISSVPELADSEYVAHFLPALGAALRDEEKVS
jgi:MSHA biogenesis protein MshI